jgi:hypothetical protein
MLIKTSSIFRNLLHLSSRNQLIFIYYLEGLQDHAVSSLVVVGNDMRWEQ